jgi:murein L,D-transpeptidase YafK
MTTWHLRLWTVCRPLVVAAAAGFAAAALGGCDHDSAPALNGRHMQPLSERMVAELDKHNMSKESPLLVRIFKEESELEVWKEDRSGRFALLKTYPICRWSGELGPKFQVGDHQAPEGFYTITPDLMNPNSNYYLAINTGYPNTYDRANGRTGEFLMIHGDCKSVGCYAMTDEQIAEIYALARESFFGGQKSFQIQAYPFHMTPLNLARHRDSTHMPFWKMLKQGYDHFEVTRLAPKIDVCEKRYVFNAESMGAFNAAERCPAYRVPQQIAAAVHQKERRDDIQIASLIRRGVPTAPDASGGGTHSVFLSGASRTNPGVTIRTASAGMPLGYSAPLPAAPASTTASVAGQPPRVVMPGGATPSKREPVAQQTKEAAVQPKSEPASSPRREPASTPSLLSGAQPALPAGGFSPRPGGPS